MKKTLLSLVAILGIAAVSGAQTQTKTIKKTADKTPTEISCEVMPDDKLNIKEATAAKRFRDYKGRRYFFCCEGCPKKFDKDPAKYAKAASIPTPTTTKVKAKSKKSA